MNISLHVHVPLCVFTIFSIWNLLLVTTCTHTIERFSSKRGLMQVFYLILCIRIIILRNIVYTFLSSYKWRFFLKSDKLSMKLYKFEINMKTPRSWLKYINISMIEKLIWGKRLTKYCIIADLIQLQIPFTKLKHFHLNQA